jgi:hypothetical protein
VYVTEKMIEAYCYTDPDENWMSHWNTKSQLGLDRVETATPASGCPTATGRRGAAALEEIRAAIPDSLRLRLEVEQDWAIRGLHEGFHSFHSLTELCGCKAWGMNYHDDVA